MKRLPPLPTGPELGLFALVAVGLSGLAALFRAHDIGMAVLAIPVFIFAAWMGMRRSGQWASISGPPEVQTPIANLEDEELAV